MQNLPIYLYPNTIDVILDLDATITGVNRIMYQRDLTIQKGIKNQVRVQFKNSDQKKVSISNTQTFVFSMFDAINQRLIIEKEIEVLETNTATRGLALLTLTESDTLDLDRSSYQYSVKLREPNTGAYTPAYSNTYYGMAGTLHLKNEVFPVLQDSVTVSSFNAVWNDQTRLYEYFSGNIYASPEYNGNTALHTAAFYLTAFKGTIYVEGTLDNSPDTSGNYSIIASNSYDVVTKVDSINFNGIYTYIRFRYVPALGPTSQDNRDTAFAGTVDKILYRS